ncbi:MAG TPA: methionyl-tRNA formyltransferase [Kiritimatiellia bacterium]|nr:methionyl-tRNA formyltransferase [Kiritimatiellia bacterium]HRZ11476.1 methionyl-tRNA formyltransferase [Kiritimatiellia bacterium]HSA16973.1 methionyl-tRNA formyltransferase [Kiritimatiellia bacterium]
MPDKTYVVAGCKSWNRLVFDETIRRGPGAWRYVGDPAELTLERLAPLAPRYIFFLHWSWKVPEEIVSRYECVCFHMTDVPYGRGGSPLQNLIVRGHSSTKLAALRMEGSFDSGPVYLKKDLSLEGSVAEILVRATHLSAGMIREIVATEPAPRPQEGTPVVFKRRKPAESRIPRVDSLGQLYDFVRMLDGEGYPPAFLEHEGFRYEFRRAALRGAGLEAEVRVTPIQEDKP